MDRQRQQEFTKELVQRVKDELLAVHDSGRIPEDWDGIELRWWIAEHFTDVVIGHIGAGGRKRRYNNAVLTLNL